MVQPVHFKAIVEQIERHDDTVVSYHLKADKRLPRFIPGQFIHLAIDDYDPASFWPESRVFSVANAVADRYTMVLTISRQGHYTGRILDQVHLGSVLWGKGPYGEFSIDGTHGKRAILIAGGTGITPFCAFMDAAIAQGKLPLEEAVLYYGARTPDLLIYRPLADRCAAKVPGFRVSYHAEKTGPGNDAVISTGTLDVATIMAEICDTGDTVFYLSGPKAMITSFQSRLVEEFGIPRLQVQIDAWE